MQSGQKARFKECLKFVLKWEGGYSEHPNDPGGATMKGITQSVYDSWRKSKGLPTRHVRNITDDEVEAIYWEKYWQPLRCSELPAPLDLVCFDSGVNCGIGRAARWLRAALGMPAATTVTPEVIAKVKQHKNIAALAKAVCDLREQHYINISNANPKLKVFLKGWLNRLNDLRKQVGLIK